MNNTEDTIAVNQDASERDEKALAEGPIILSRLTIPNVSFVSSKTSCAFLLLRRLFTPLGKLSMHLVPHLHRSQFGETIMLISLSFSSALPPRVSFEIALNGGNFFKS